jgi:PAS domain S-box-containing protein
MASPDLIRRLGDGEAGGPRGAASGREGAAVAPVARPAGENEGARLAEFEEEVRPILRVVEQGFSAVLIADAGEPEPRVVYVNPAFTRATGYRAGEVVGRPLSFLAGLTSVQERLRAGMPQGQHFLEEISTYQTAGGERWGEWRVGPVTDNSGRTTHWLVIFRDITERKRLEKEILEISDRERQRIGRDLHDGLCQHLAGIELMSQLLEQRLAARFRAGAAQAGEIARHIRDAISQTRLLARGLSPVTLESEGLCSALEELAVNTEKMFSVSCRFQCESLARITDRAVAMHLYRIAQEAVSNAIKHGKATEIRIDFRQSDNRVCLAISDNGSGFPGAEPSVSGMGLRIMRYRASVVGGSLALERNPVSGITVTCSVPAPFFG